MQFYQSIQKYISGFEEQLPELPGGIESLLPYTRQEATGLANTFYQKYYSDELTRSLILGINPGRNGAGLTGIPFTDSKRLEEKCAIITTLKSHEPSSEFIYHIIDAFGGVDKFYHRFFISSISPVGFVKEGKNYNYYDEHNLSIALKPYIIFQMNRLLALNLRKHKIICLGEGKNYKFLKNLNEQYYWFEDIVALPHPRFIMQYKRKELSRYTDLYINALNSII